MFDQELFAKFIQAERRQRDLTLREMEAETGINYTTLNRIENGVNAPSIHDFFLLCEWGKVKTDDFAVRYAVQLKLPFPPV